MPHSFANIKEPVSGFLHTISGRHCLKYFELLTNSSVLNLILHQAKMLVMKIWFIICHGSLQNWEYQIMLIVRNIKKALFMWLFHYNVNSIFQGLFCVWAPPMRRHYNIMSHWLGAYTKWSLFSWRLWRKAMSSWGKITGYSVLSCSDYSFW